MWMFSINKRIKEQLEEATVNLFAVQKAKNVLVLEQQTIKAKLENDKVDQEMAFKKDRHAMNLELQEKEENFAREKKNWEADKNLLKETLTKKAEITLEEIKSLAKLDSQQQIAQLNLTHKKDVMEQEAKNNKELSDLKAKAATELSDLTAKLAKEYYGKAEETLKKFSLEGDKTTKFMQELAIAMFNKAPLLNKLDVGINTPKAKLIPEDSDKK